MDQRKNPVRFVNRFEETRYILEHTRVERVSFKNGPATLYRIFRLMDCITLEPVIQIA